MANNNGSSVRQTELVGLYKQALNTHLVALKEGRAERTLELRELARALHVHPCT